MELLLSSSSVWADDLHLAIFQIPLSSCEGCLDYRLWKEKWTDELKTICGGYKVIFGVPSFREHWNFGGEVLASHCWFRSGYWDNTIVLGQELVSCPLLFVVLEDVASNWVCHTQVWGWNARMQFVMVRYAWATQHSLCHVPVIWVFSSFAFAKGNKIRCRWKDEKCHNHPLQQQDLGNQIFSLYHPRVFSFCSAPLWWGTGILAFYQGVTT